GDTDEIRNVDNTKSYIGTSGGSKGKNLGPEYYTIFDGETGEPLSTTAAIPLGTSDYWGDTTYNRCERFLSGVAYLDGVHPSLIECRGYYARVMIRAYTFDGEALSMQWEYNSSGSGLYGEGFHNLGIADIDNDGKDEIVYGSACLDDDGKTVLGDTNLGHGDAQHTSDFNNDGIQESFVVHEEKEGYANYAGDFKVTATGAHFWGTKATSDTGRGVMDNIDDEYASTHPDALAMAWESSNAYAYDLKGNAVGVKPTAGSRTMTNFLVYWDGDLGRELLDDNIIAKYHVADGGDTSYTRRFYGPSDGYTLYGGSSNNYTKNTPSLVADIWGDWREEVIMPINKTSSTEQAYLRIYTSTIPTQYRLTTLMHDCQYRESVAWQNVGYNQPTHTSYYIGSAALASDGDGNTLNYLAPAVPFTKVGYDIDKISVEGISLSEESIYVEKNHTARIEATITPSDATQKGITWTSSDPSVATVSGGVVTGVNKGTATITAKTRDGGYTATCEVEVWSNPVTGVELSASLLNIGLEQSKRLTATVTAKDPEMDASDPSVMWRSSNTSVATVSSDGVVTGVSSGLTTIYATTVDGGFEAACVANVVPVGSEDVTGEDIFISSDADGTASVLSNASATGATLSQTDAETGAEFHRSFEAYSDNKAILTLHFTTGGQRINDTTWNWNGHEYTLNLSFLDTEGDNILTIAQPYTTAEDHDNTNDGILTSKFGNDAPIGLTSGWNTVIDGVGQIQGSTKRWILTLEFDYEKDICNATIIGTDGTWAANNAEYTTSFGLNGASFQTIKCYTTKDGEGTIYAKPQIEAVSYSRLTPVAGASNVLYKRGAKTGTPWTSDDIKDWTQTNQTTAALALDETNGRVWYNPTKPSAEYSASKTFDVSDNATLTYDVDWYFGSSTGRAVNYEYIQFGNKLRLGWMTDGNGGYYVLPSTDGGTTYEGLTSAPDESDATKTVYTVDESKKLFKGVNSIYTKNVQVVFDTAANTIKTLKFDGQTIDAYTDYPLPDDATVNSVTFGLQRGGGTSNWAYPNGIDNITVSQFALGETPKYPVKFVNYDNSLLQSVNTDIGTMPEYTGATPTRPQDSKYTYTFTGWSPALTVVIDEAVYTAQYTETPRTYNVTLNTNDGVLTGDNVTSYTYGKAVTLPTATRGKFTFDGWYDNAALTGTAVTEIPATAVGDKTYYAKWTSSTSVMEVIPNGTAVDVNFVLVSDNYTKAQVIGVLYDGNVLKEVSATEEFQFVNGALTSKQLNFNNNVADHTLKVYIWNSINGMVPLITE
ncbi:MAG: Ig-like domain-containing protein, partial [Hominilimicola sp.]